MNKIRYIMKAFLPILLIILFVECGTSIKKLSDIKWSGNNTGISEKIETKGYYKLAPNMHEAFVFYEDGTIVLCSRIPDDTTTYSGGYWPLGCTYQNSIGRWDGGTTGLYRIEGDTIFANMYFRNGFYFSLRFQIPFETWMYKMRFQILDRTKVVWIDEHLMDKEYPEPEMKNDTLIFYNAVQLPPPNTEMKKKRWLWDKH